MPPTPVNRWLIVLKVVVQGCAAAIFSFVMAIAPLSSFANERRGEVLLYYANETAPSARESSNFDTIIGWLRAGKHPNHAQVVESLERDRRICASVVDVEIDALVNGIPHVQDGPQAIIFNNRRVRQGKCLIWRHGWKEFRERDFPIPKDENYILEANPLSRPQTLRDVLTFAAQEFAPAKHDFVLITKGHGSVKKAITPRLAVRSEETNREEILRVAADQVDEHGLPNWAGRLGVSKEEYLSILNDAGQRLRMRFSLVFLEACKAYTKDITIDRIPNNVDRLLLMWTDSHYSNFLYGDVLKKIDAQERLSDLMSRNLAPKFVLLGRDLPSPSLNPTPARLFPLWGYYFIPLVMWMGWIVWRWQPWKSRTDK